MRKSFLVVFCLFLMITPLWASSSLPLSLEQKVDRAKAIFRGTVLSQSSFRNPQDGGIYTRTILQVDEVFKGKFPANVQVIHRGGVFDEEGETDGFAPRFAVGEERLMFLDRRADGTLFAYDGGASAIVLHLNPNGPAGGKDLIASDRTLVEEVRQRARATAAEGIDTTDQSAQTTPTGGSAITPKVIGGLIADANGISSRFPAPDRGEKIPVLIDTQALPAGITQVQALGAVTNVLRAWSQVCSVQFVIEGLTNFGTAAPNAGSSDGKIRLQLHDLYGFITGSSILGQGGRYYAIPGAFPNGGMGGNVGGAEFFQSTRGYVVLKHTQSAMQTLSTFEEVLCHEVGHVLSLDHSSENPSESDTTLKQAIMYYAAHADGRGASPTAAYDVPKIKLVHPLNTPPYGYDRVMDIVTASTAPNVTGINSVELRGYDLQSSSVAVTLTNQTANNGSFSLVGTTLKFTPAANYGDSGRLDPAGNSYYDAAYARFSDGTNGSPFAFVRVLSFNHDSQPTTSDGIPDTWMTTYFGNANPNIGSLHHASDDYDGDGISNLNEYRSGTDPTVKNSALKILSYSKTNLQFLANPYDLYEIQTSTNLSTWTLATNPVIPMVTNASYSGLANPSWSRQFFRVVRVP